MSNELRAAAETILRCIDTQETELGVKYLRNDTPGMGLAEPYRLAEAYLAEHPADDDEPANREWVSGFARKRRCWPDQYILDEISVNYYLEFDCSPLEHKEQPDCSVLLRALPERDEDGVVLLYHATRGDVRRLCKALGVPLKEGE